MGCLLAACDRGASSDHDDAPAHADDHDEHEPAHGEAPTRVTLTPQVIADAGIETEVARHHALAPTVRLPGEIVADPDRRARIAARLPGIVESTKKRPGERVETGETVVVVRAPDIQALRSTEAALRARASSAKANAERLAALVPKRMASEQELVAARAEADALEAEARAARDRLKAIGVGRSGRGPILYSVRAPMAGVLVERPVVEGDPVTAQSVVATIVGLDRVWFLAHVFERDVSRVDLGAAVSVALNAYPDETFEGVIDYISHQTDPGARTLSARIPLTNRDDKLRLGLFGTAYTTVGPPDGAPVLAVPRSALVRVRGSDAVFVRHEEGDFELHEVVLGRSDAHRIEITHGLRDGEEVVTAGAFSVKSVLLAGTFGEHGH
jgi:cobalt-zinc-cadmium efflux system membrane fusion protein